MAKSDLSMSLAPAGRPCVHPFATLVACQAAASAASSCWRARMATSEMSFDQTSLYPCVSTSNGPSSWPGPFIASRRLAVCQPLRRSGTCTIWPRVGFGIGGARASLIVVFCRPVVNIV